MVFPIFLLSTMPWCSWFSFAKELVALLFTMSNKIRLLSNLCLHMSLQAMNYILLYAVTISMLESSCNMVTCFVYVNILLMYEFISIIK